MTEVPVILQSDVGHRFEVHEISVTQIAERFRPDVGRGRQLHRHDIGLDAVDRPKLYPELADVGPLDIHRGDEVHEEEARIHEHPIDLRHLAARAVELPRPGVAAEAPGVPEVQTVAAVEGREDVQLVRPVVRHHHVVVQEVLVHDLVAHRYRLRLRELGHCGHEHERCDKLFHELILLVESSMCERWLD